MNRKLTVLSLAVVAAIAIAVPALGASGSVTPTVTNELATRALAKARLALLTACSAKSQSRVAVRTAGAAVNTANEANGTAQAALKAAKDGTEAKSLAAATKGELDSTHVQSGFAAEAVTTESTSFAQLPGGPSVTVNVPASGLIEVWAQATMDDPGIVSLYEDGKRMPGQAEICGPVETEGALFGGFFGGPSGSITVGTPASAGACGTEGAPGSVLFQTTPGKHTYELRYAVLVCGCFPEVTFSNRLLRVAGRL